ncbi:hypothetical protein J4429_00075 [Candidatus Pacearchaeota archaeon]|nr:hypothetical protein [Candidatus Pacearchaeota archaeon]
MEIRVLKGFTVENWKHRFLPSEDVYRFSQSGKSGILSVADGITRDPTNGTLPNLDSIFGKVQFVLGYPKPSPAFYVANMFCKSFNSYFESMPSGKRINEDSIFESFRIANQIIRNFNNKFFPYAELDFLKRDYTGCVASGAIADGRDVFYGYIADSGFIVLDDKGNIRFKTENEGPNSKGNIDEDVAKKYRTGFKFPKGRTIIRSQYRNNPDEPLAYGALTGQTEAMNYVRTGYFELQEGDVPIVFTDGLESVIQSPEFAEKIRERDFKGIKKLCRRKVRTEGTLVCAL